MTWPPLAVPSLWAVLFTIAFWPTWIYLCGFTAHRLPAQFVARDSWLTRPRAWERNGRWYADHLHIRRWKDRVPEAGAAFAGGFAKRTTNNGDIDTLRVFIAETRRAEYAHWAMGSGWIVTSLWSPWYAVVLNVLFGLVWALPFVAIQRYNRPRLVRALAVATAR
jgi:glycosyl-4,4'-diaponeurosporenoate acyltransferase